MRHGGAMWLASWVWLAAALPHAGEAPTPGVVNGGFELDADKDGVPDGWALEALPDARPGQVSLDHTIKREGRCSVRFRSTTDFDSSLRQVVPVERGAVYRLSVWVKTADLRVPSRVRVHGTMTLGVRGSLVAESGTNRAGTTDWVKDEVDFVAPNTGSTMVSVTYADWGPATGTVWFDGLTLTRLAPKGGLATLTEPPQGCRARAEWALGRTPVDWAVVADAIDAYYAGAARAGTPIDKYVGAICAEAQASAEVRAHLVTLLGRRAWRMSLRALSEIDSRAILKEAVAAAARDPKRAAEAASARLGLARVIAVLGNEPADAAGKALTEAVGADAERRRQLADVLLRDAGTLRSGKQNAAASRLYDILIAVFGPDDPQRNRVDLARLGFLRATGATDAARQAAEQLATAKRKIDRWDRAKALRALAMLAAEANNAEDVARWLAEGDKLFARDLPARAKFHLAFAKALAGKERWADAAGASQRIVASFPQDPASCFEAQRLLVQAFTTQRLFDEALAAAKVLYGAAPNSEKEITEAVNLIMHALRARHRSIALANRFVVFQSHGPNGQDGKPGTEDDVTDPLAKIQYAPSADVEALFKQTLASVPADLAGRRWRGYLYLYWGKSELALKEFVWRYDHAPLETKAVNEAIDDIVVGLKAYVGHTLAGEQFMDYQTFGPEGKDGKPNTDDDPKDVLEDLFKKP